MMLKSDLIERIAAENPHLHRQDVETLVNTILDSITAALARGDRVELRDFGVHATVQRSRYLPPIIFPGRPERWWGDEALKAETDAPQATLEQRHQAAGDVLALRCRGFFSAGALLDRGAHTPVETAQ